MNRPYIICHMTMSIDGKVTGDFLDNPECGRAVEVYYEINRSLRCNGFICGRVTMETSFTQGWYPDLTELEPCGSDQDFVPENKSGFYAAAFDTKGSLGWRSAFIEDEDPGYDKAQIVEVLSRRADRRYLTFLRNQGIPYIFAGEAEIDVSLALFKLRSLFGMECLLLEGGSIINGAFLRAGAVDELSLVTAPVLADSQDKPLFMDGTVKGFELTEVKDCQGAVCMRYKRREDMTEKKKIAFICVHNSCRSQIAEALGKHLAGDRYDFYSAGTETKPQINQDAVRLMKKLCGIDMEETQYSKTFDRIPAPDIAVSMGCDVGCPFIGRAFDDNWGLADPTGKSDEDFEDIIRQIEERILGLDY